MLVYLETKATSEQIQQAAEDLDGYIKFVVNIKTEEIVIGGSRHVMAEELLLSKGSKQDDLWGGGFDIETKELDYDSMINIRPHQGNTSREVIDQSMRKRMKEIITRYLPV